MKTRARRWLILPLLFLALASVAPKPAAADEDDPPYRVARLSYIHGQVSFNPAGTDDWVSAVVNRPITTGDKLWTDGGARAELHIGSAAIRLSGQTGFSFLNLDDHMMQIRLTEGTVGLRVRRLASDESIEIDTPNLAFSILRPGRYRLNVNENGDATIINVEDGQGEVTGGGAAYTVYAGQQGYFSGTDYLEADIQRLRDEDDFDRWSDSRDYHEEHSVSRRYVSDDVIGYEDLDDYGGWRPVPEYGTVWFPHVTVVGWAPYRYGHWVWISPWGWTWVDDEPWGFAPFHYGRWVSVGGAWGWVPCPPPVVGVAYIRPVYAPALVAWVGGPHFAVGIGFGSGGGVGWFPLGPREVYAPSYPVSRTYINNVNISNTTVNQTVINNYYNTTVVNKNVNVNNVRYVNQNVANAVTVTTPKAFTSAQPVARNLVAVNQRDVASAPVAVAAPAVVPPKQAVLGAGNAARVQPPAAALNRPVVAKVAPPPPPVAFQQRQAAIQANQGRPISVQQTRQLESEHATVAAPPVKMAPPARPAAPRTNTAVAPPNRPERPAQDRPERPAQGNPPPPAPAANPNRPPVAPQPAPGAQVNQRPSAPPSTSAPVQQPNQPGRPGNAPRIEDRPPTARPMPANPQLEQRHQQQSQELQQRQDQERQRLEQKQQQEQQKIQQRNAPPERQRAVQQKEERQLQQMEQKHDQQRGVLQQRQDREHAQNPPPPKNPPPPPKERNREDRPPR